MEILGIDTATKCCGATVLNEAGVRAHFSLNTGLTHSQSFLPMVSQLLEHARLKLEDMSAVALTVGPGSFTGLRIGISTAKAWGQALGLPLIGVSTLEALSAASCCEGLVCPVLDARKNEVYSALFNQGARLWEDRASSPLELLNELKGLSQPITIIGDGVNVFFEAYNQFEGELELKEAPEMAFVTASWGAAVLGRRIYAEGNFLISQELEPVYLRLSEAEARRLKALERLKQ